MYQHRTRDEYLKVMGLPSDYTVDAVLVIGTHPKAKEYPHLYEALENVCPGYVEEKIQYRFFSDVKSFTYKGMRIWFDVVYGTAYLSEVLHVGCLYGSKQNILLGTCGGLQSHLHAGDTILPSSSFGNESSTRMYQRQNSEYVYKSDEMLRGEIKKRLTSREVIIEEKMVTVQAMLAETQEDVDEWARAGYVAVDMESATVFAVSKYFNVPAAALLYVADNLVTNELVGGEAHARMKEKRLAIRNENYEIALRTLLRIP